MMAKKEMDEIIAYCGGTCNSCAIFLATRDTDDEKRHAMRVEIAQTIKVVYGTECKPEDVTDCDGCKTETGRLHSGCSKCQIRKCAREKSIENCAHCNEYACEKLEKFFTTDPQARKRLDQIKKEL